MLIAKRTLDECEHRIFRYHLILGADWKLCCRQMKLDRGNFFHAVYRIQQKLGRAFAETQPYGIFPLDEYFGGTIHNQAVAARVMRQERPEIRRLMFPLARPMRPAA
jgi:hypothetical protein